MNLNSAEQPARKFSIENMMSPARETSNQSDALIAGATATTTPSPLNVVPPSPNCLRFNLSSRLTKSSSISEMSAASTLDSSSVETTSKPSRDMASLLKDVFQMYNDTCVEVEQLRRRCSRKDKINQELTLKVRDQQKKQDQLLAENKSLQEECVIMKAKLDIPCEKCHIAEERVRFQEQVIQRLCQTVGDVRERPSVSTSSDTVSNSRASSVSLPTVSSAVLTSSLTTSSVATSSVITSSVITSSVATSSVATSSVATSSVTAASVPMKPSIGIATTTSIDGTAASIMSTTETINAVRKAPPQPAEKLGHDIVKKSRDLLDDIFNLSNSESDERNVAKPVHVSIGCSGDSTRTVDTVVSTVRSSSVATSKTLVQSNALVTSVVAANVTSTEGNMVKSIMKDTVADNKCVKSKHPISVESPSIISNISSAMRLSKAHLPLADMVVAGSDVSGKATAVISARESSSAIRCNPGEEVWIADTVVDVETQHSNRRRARAGGLRRMLNMESFPDVSIPETLHVELDIASSDNDTDNESEVDLKDVGSRHPPTTRSNSVFSAVDIPARLNDREKFTAAAGSNIRAIESFNVTDERSDLSLHDKKNANSSKVYHMKTLDVCDSAAFLSAYLSAHQNDGDEELLERTVSPVFNNVPAYHNDGHNFIEVIDTPPLPVRTVKITDSTYPQNTTTSNVRTSSVTAACIDLISSPGCSIIDTSTELQPSPSVLSGKVEQISGARVVEAGKKSSRYCDEFDEIPYKRSKKNKPKTIPELFHSVGKPSPVLRVGNKENVIQSKRLKETNDGKSSEDRGSGSGFKEPKHSDWMISHKESSRLSKQVANISDEYSECDVDLNGTLAPGLNLAEYNSSIPHQVTHYEQQGSTSRDPDDHPTLDLNETRYVTPLRQTVTSRSDQISRPEELSVDLMFGPEIESQNEFKIARGKQPLGKQRILCGSRERTATGNESTTPHNILSTNGLKNSSDLSRKAECPLGKPTDYKSNDRYRMNPEELCLDDDQMEGLLAGDPANAEEPVDNESLLSDDSFSRLPSKKPDVNYAYVDVVRKKHLRQQMDAFACEQCEKWYRGMGLNGEELRERMKSCRHKAQKAPTSTPDHYWSVTFPTTQECKERGYLQTAVIEPSKFRRKRKLCMPSETEISAAESSKSNS